MKQPISFKARVIKREGDEYIDLFLLPADEKARKYTRQGSGHISPSQRRIRLSQIIEQFQNDDLIKVTFKKIKGDTA